MSDINRDRQTKMETTTKEKNGIPTKKSIYNGEKLVEVSSHRELRKSVQFHTNEYDMR